MKKLLLFFSILLFLGGMLTSLQAQTCATRVVSNTINCSHGYHYQIYLNKFDGSDIRLASTSSTWEECSDGTAEYHLVETSIEGDVIEIYLFFSGGTTVAPTDSPKDNNCAPTNTSGWVYYPITSGSIVSSLHGVFSITRKGPSFQLGENANQTGVGFGGSGWLEVDGGDGYYTHGDINVMMSSGSTPVCNISVDAGLDQTICASSGPVALTAVLTGAAACTPPTSCGSTLVTYSGNCDDPSDCLLPSSTASCLTSVSGVCPTEGESNASCNNNIICISSEYNSWGFSMTATNNVEFQAIEADFWYPTDGSSAGGAGNSSSCPTIFNYTVIFEVDGVIISTVTQAVPENAIVTQMVAPSSSIFVPAGSTLSIRIDGHPSSTSCDLFELAGLRVLGCCNSSTPMPIEDNTFAWSGPGGFSSNAATITVSTAGVYNVTVTDCKGCTATDNVTVTVHNPSVDAGPNQTICSGTNVNLAATGSGGTYTWSHGLGNGPNKTVTPSTTTTYSVTLTDSNGCTAVDHVMIVVNESPNLDLAFITQVMCTNEPIAVGVGGMSFGGTMPYMYHWTSTGGSFNNPNIADPLFTATDPGSYTLTLTITDAYGCSDSDHINIAFMDCEMSIGSTVFIDADDSGTQGGGEAGIAGVLVQVYSAGPNGVFEMGMGDDVLEGDDTTNGAGDYYIGGLNSGDYQVVIPASNFSGALGAYPTSSTGNGGDDEVDNDDNGMQSAIGAKVNSAPINLSVGAEPLSESAQGGGQDVANGVADENGDMTIDFGFIPCTLNTTISPDAMICEGESTTLTASGGDTYMWNTGETTASITVSPAATATYSVIIGSSTCTTNVMADVTVTVIPLPNVSAGDDVFRCIGETSFSTLTATGASAYIWSTGETSPSISVMPTSTTNYTVTGSSNGCSAQDEVTVFIQSCGGGGDTIGIVLSADIILGGAGDVGGAKSSGIMMHDKLREAGLIPLTDPYGLGEYTLPFILRDRNGQFSVVDWVKIELRDKDDMSVVACKAALVRRDGHLIDPLNENADPEIAVPAGDYYVVITHRNHGSVMSAAPVPLSDIVTHPCDFTDPSTPTWGSGACYLEDGYMMMYGGNGNGDGWIRATGPTFMNDASGLILHLGHFSNIEHGYSPYDYNMDGVVRVTGPTFLNDFSELLLTLGHFSTVVSGQTP